MKLYIPKKHLDIYLYEISLIKYEDRLEEILLSVINKQSFYVSKEFFDTFKNIIMRFQTDESEIIVNKFLNLIKKQQFVNLTN